MTAANLIELKSRSRGSLRTILGLQFSDHYGYNLRYMYRLILVATGIPSHEGPSGAECITEEFTHGPWHSNVKCEWDGTQLILQAENDYDADGLALMDEFSDAISACISDVGDGDIKVLSITALPDPSA